MNDPVKPVPPVRTPDGELRCVCGHPYVLIDWFLKSCPNCGVLLGNHEHERA